jgi:hypothetical protein
MQAHKINLASRTILQELVQPDNAIWTIRYGWGAKESAASEGLHILLVGLCCVVGSDASLARAAAVGLVEGEEVVRTVSEIEVGVCDPLGEMGLVMVNFGVNRRSTEFV